MLPSTVIARSVLLVAACTAVLVPLSGEACGNKSEAARQVVPESGPPEAVNAYEAGQSAEKRGANREAIELYRQAARKGSDFARIRLSEIYGEGLLGVPADGSAAYGWWPYDGKYLRPAC
jgi:hypothetical protein